MQRELRVAILLVVVTVAFAASVAFAQQPQNECPHVEYSERTTTAHRYRLKRIEGQAVYGNVSDKGELISASELCLSLFNRKDKRLVASTTTQSGGQFQFRNVSPGDYLLIVSVGALHELIVPVTLTNNQTGKRGKRRQLLLHLRSKEDSKKSFTTLIAEPDLREELLERLRKDQAIRDEMIAIGADISNKAMEARAAVIDSENTARMKEIVKKYGWPGPELVGTDGANAAFLLVQHSPDFAFERAMLPLVRLAYEDGKLSAWSYALLVDRVLVREGKPQMYGMSVNHWKEKEPVLDPIEDEANVDYRRAKIGLPPLHDYLDGIKKQYFPEQREK